MTAPIVGQVAVEVIASGAALVKSLKKEIEGSFKDVDFGKAIRDSGGNAKVKVEVDPVLSTFQSQMRAEINALAKTVNAKVPVGVDGGRLRAELSAELAAAQRQLKAKIPLEPDGQAEYALKLRAAVDRASAEVKAKIRIEPDSKSGGSFLSAIKNLFGGAGGALGSAFSGGGAGGNGPFSWLSNILPSVSGLSSAFSSLGSEIEKSAGSSAQLGGSLAGAAESAAGPVGVILGIVVAVGVALGVATAGAYALGGALTLVSAGLSVAAGAAAAIPAALAGIGAVVGTLGLGLDGISAAFKPKTRGGGGGGGESSAQHARQVAAAERSLAQSEQGLADAQERSRLAQVAVNQARKDAVEDIDDLGRALRGAKLDEADAAQAVQDSLLALNTAKLSGNIPDINRANLAYQRAQLTLDNAKDSAEDLGLKQADAAKKGVAGSDKVQQALRDQASAQEAVRSAQDGVLSAQDGLASATEKQGAAASAAAAKQIKLADSARKFVDAVKALKPAFESLRLDVQQRLFAGLDKTVTSMWKAWKSQLHITLGGFADTFNEFLRDLGAQASKPKFIADLAAGAEGARLGIQSIGTAVTSKLVPAFGTLARAAGPFLAQFGAEIAQVVTDFSNWISQSQKTKALSGFFDHAAAAMHSLFTTGKLVVKIIGDIFTILTGAPSDTKKSPLDSFNDGLAAIDRWLSDPKHQQQIQGIIASVEGMLTTFGQDFQQVNTLLKNLSSDSGSESIGETIGRNLVAGIIAGVGKAIAVTAVKLALYFSPFGPLIQPIKNILGIHSPSTVFAQIGRDLIQGLINGVGGMFGRFGSALAQIPGLVGRAVKGAGSWLVDIGRAIIDGLRRGISNALPGLGSFLSGVGEFIREHKGPIDKDRKLLVGAGRAIMGGLITGIDDGKGALAAKLSDVTGMFGGASLSSAADLAVSHSLSAASRQQVLVSMDPARTGDWLMDGLRQTIKVKYRGDVTKALSTT